MLEHLRDLMGHQEWADATLEDEVLRRRTEHNVFVQEGFRKLILEEPLPGGLPSGLPPNYADLNQRARAATAALRRLLAAALDEKSLAQVVRPPWAPDTPHALTVGDVLVQVAMHSQHHRGQNMTRLKDLGGAAVNVDWIIWFWQGKPEGRWD